MLIHGANGHMQTWDGVVSRLSDSLSHSGARLARPWLTGRHPQDDYSAEAMRDAALAVMDAEGIDTAVWAGNSMGGWVTWRAALSVPERISGVILLDASGAPLDEPRELYLGARLINTRWGQWLMPKITPKALIKTSLKGNYTDEDLITETLITRYWELLRVPGNRQATVIRANMDREPNYWNQITQLTQPTLIIWGADDVVVPLSAAAKFDAAIPNSERVILSGIGHLPMEEAPEVTADTIGKWLAVTIDQN